MAENDAFFVPGEVDKQIEDISQAGAGDQLDIEAMTYLRSHYQLSEQQEQAALNRMWARIASAKHFEQRAGVDEKGRPMQQIPTPFEPGAMGNPPHERPRRTRLPRQVSLIAAAILLVVLVGSMTIVFYAARQNVGGTSSTHPVPPGAVNHAPLHVTSVTISVNPGSLANIPCGTDMTVVYTATFHVTAHSVGGTVVFNYTMNNGRSQSPAKIHFSSGQTTQTYTFTWQGALPFDHTAPGPGGVQVTSPNQLTSPLVAPTGKCTSAKFQVTDVTMAVSPASIQGMTCGTSLVVTYKATIHVAAHSSGGAVQFTYTVNNGRGQSPASVTFGPGQTTQTYTFTWQGALPADHTYPGRGGIQVTSPNQLTSSLVAPTGVCS